MKQKELKDTKIAVVGIGGVGGYLAGMLTRVFDQVTLCARGDRGAFIKENGLLLKSGKDGTSLTHPARVVESADLLGNQDIIFVCVKNYSLEEVGKLLNKVVSDHTIIVPVMNGVDPGDRLRRMLTKGTVVDSLIYIVSYANEDYSISHPGQYADIKFGIMNASDEEWKKVEKVDEILSFAGIDHASSRDVEAEIWKKYMLNCAYNVLTAVYDNTIGQLCADPVKAQQIRDLVGEAFMVAQKKGVHVSQEDADSIIARMFALDGSGTSSLQRDIVAGRKAEIETFGGYIVKEARKLGMELPVSEKMYQRLLKLEEK